MTLSELGRHGEALEAEREAVAVHRRLAAESPAATWPTSPTL
ncbi:hypothetical protein ACFQ0B_36155 [Nonomuraea thailandensis]